MLRQESSGTSEMDCCILMKKRGILFVKQKVVTTSGGIAMIEATSCGGVVIFRGKVLVLYKNYKNKYEGWVLQREQ